MNFLYSSQAPFTITNASIQSLYTALSSIISNTILENSDIPRPEFIYGHGFERGTSGTVSDLINHYKFNTEGIKQLTLKRLKK